MVTGFANFDSCLERVCAELYGNKAYKDITVTNLTKAEVQARNTTLANGYTWTDASKSTQWTNPIFYDLVVSPDRSDNHIIKIISYWAQGMKTLHTGTGLSLLLLRGRVRKYN